MKRIIFVLFAFLLLFSGCGGNNKSIVIDFETFAADMLESDAFSEKLGKLDSDIGFSLYKIDSAECKQAVFYLSSGATAEELTLFEAINEQAAANIRSAIEKRVDYQISSFKDYVPEEVPKLNEYILYTNGNYVIFCTANNYDAAKAVFNKL